MRAQLAVGPAVFAVSAVVFAQSSIAGDPPDQLPGGRPHDIDTQHDRLSLDLSLTYASDYFFRGIVQRSEAFSLQPAAEIRFRLLDNESLSLSIVGGSWNNFSDRAAPGRTDAFAEHWYEHDAYAGVCLSTGRFTLDAVYTWYFSPASDFTEVEDGTLSLSYADSDHWGKDGLFSLNPSISFALETRNAASGPDSGVWFGLALEPTISLDDSFLGPVALSFPVGVGLSLDGYYQRADGSTDAFGYAEIGTKVSFQLNEKFNGAAPTLDLGASYLRLAGVLDDLNAGVANEVVFTLGLSWSF